jgi:NhaP-type Na+/H+ or K+/H+ antiporter
VVIVAFAVGESFQGLPIFEIISISSIMVVIVGIVLGAAVGYLFGWLEKRQTK